MKTNLSNPMVAIRLALGMLLIMASVMGCSKKSTTAPVNPYGGTNGQATFWASNANASLYPISVTVNGTTIGVIGGMLNASPDCQNAANNVVKFVKEPGTYNFTCSAAGNAGNWTGSFTITNGGCYLAQLK